MGNNPSPSLPLSPSQTLALALALALTLAQPPDARAAPVSPAPTPAAAILLGAWTAAERAAIDGALAKLPAATRARGPRFIARDAPACDPDGWPDDDALVDQHGHIHLCRPARAVPPSAVARQVTVALLFACDDTAAWSDDPAWRRLNRWQPSIAAGFQPRAANLDPAGFAEPRGRRSPRWDLATFTAALLLDPAGDDGGIGCRLISQTAFVRRRAGAALGPTRCAAFEDWADLDHLAGIEVVLAAPSTAMIGSLFGHLFLRLIYRDDAGAAPPHLSRTVAFLADNDVPFTEDPTYALKGIVGSYTASLHERGFLDAYRDYVVIEGRDLRRWQLNLGARERDALLQRIWTVAHGGKYAYYFFRRNCATLMIDLVDDSRWPATPGTPPGLLAAPPASTLEPWADTRTPEGTPLLQFVAEPILSFDHQARLAARHRTALEPMLAARPPPPPEMTSSEITTTADLLAAAFHDVHAVAPAQRAAGYDRLARLLSKRSAGDTTVLVAWLRDSALIESQLSALANIQAEERADRERRLRVGSAAGEVAARLRGDAAALRALPRSTAPEVAARLDGALAQVTAFEPTVRLDGYRALLALTRDPALAPDVADRLRLLALLQSELRYDVPRMKSVTGLRDALLFVDPEQPIDRQRYLDGHQALLRVPCMTQVAAPLRAVQRAKETLFAARALGHADEGDDEENDPLAITTSTSAARRDYDAALPKSGIDRLAVLGGVMVGSAPARSGLVVSGALYDEQLGDHRRFGFPSDTALVVGRSALFVTLAGRAPTIAAYDARLFGYRSLRPPLPESGSGRWPLGWELFGTLAGDRARALATEAKIGWGLLAPIVDRGELTDHLLAGLALSYAAAFPTDGATAHDWRQAVSAPLSLELRSGLGAAPRYRGWLAARVWFEPMAVGTPSSGKALAAFGFASETGARVELRLPLTAAAPALLVRAELLRTGVTFSGAGHATTAALGVGVEMR